MKKILWAAMLLALSLPARAVPNFTTKELVPGVTLNGGPAFSSAVFVSMTGAYTDAPGPGATGGGGVRGFYIRGSSAVYSARSTNGLAWTDESGVRLSSNTVPLIDIAISSITGATVLPLTGGGFRMMYSVIGTTGTFRIYTATSADGLNWANQFTTASVTSANSGTSWLGSPSMVQLQNGNWRLYFVQNSIAGNQPVNHQVVSMLSVDQGASWNTQLVEISPANEVAAMERTDGRVRLVMTQPLNSSATSQVMVSAVSVGVFGHQFNALEAGTRLSTATAVGSMFQPAVFRSTDSFRWRVYYTWLPFAPVNQSTGDVNAAVTDYPDLQSISPTSVANNLPNQSFALFGEIFSPVVTSSCALAGLPGMVGTGIVRTDDMDITVTYPTHGAAAGSWAVVVADANGLTSTLPASLTITAVAQGGGTVSLLNNMFRPLQGGSVTINVQTFASGNVSVKLYSMQGKLVSTLWDGNLGAGTNTFTWNGANAQGALVSSGVYVLSIKGPQLKSTSKIIVIK